MASDRLELLFQTNKAFIPYLTLGDPSLEQSKILIESAIDAGANAIEIGIPFSDPIADGPVIQESHVRALKKQPSISLQDGLDLVAELRKNTQIPLLFMADVNLVIQFGIDKFFKDSKTNGLDAIVIPDLGIDDADEFLEAANASNIHLIFLISPLNDPERIKAIVEKSSGFIYLISSTGLTGERQNMSDALEDVTQQIKSHKNIPVIVGFGISQPEHIKAVNTYADGVIVGSHLVKLIETHLPDIDQAKTAVSNRIKALIQS